MPITAVLFPLYTFGCFFMLAKAVTPKYIAKMLVMTFKRGSQKNNPNINDVIADDAFFLFLIFRQVLPYFDFRIIVYVLKCFVIPKKEDDAFIRL